MKSGIILYATLFALIGTPIFAKAQTITTPLNNPLREINITSDSAPGWIPSEVQSQSLVLALQRYFTAVDDGEYKRAYDMMTPIHQQNQAYAQFIENSHRFRDQAGPTLKRTILKITWTKDPLNAPLPGIYAAIDVAGKFTNIERECGYVVFYQKSEGDDFKLMREEIYFISNTEAKDIERTKSRATLDSLWASLSASCPNYSNN